jgi:hypothetical protein
MREFKIPEYRSYIYDKKAQVIIVKTSDSIRYFYTFGSDFTIYHAESLKYSTLKIEDDDAFEGYIQINRR